MKLIIQIPCLNEEDHLPATLADLPKKIPGISKIERLVIDDGSTDRTVEVARELGVEHIIQNTHNLGLARSFTRGIQYCLDHGADIIVNTDADNQYMGEDISKLVGPVLKGEADIVIGARPIQEIEHFSPAKKFLQGLGSLVLRLVSGTSVADAPSGFRAFSSYAAKRIFVYTRYTYTLETIIQAGQHGMKILSVPIRVNDPRRESRLMKNTVSYVFRSLFTIVRVYALYKPYALFITASLICLIPGAFLVLRFLTFYMMGDGAGHIQSVIIGSAGVAMGVVFMIAGIIADLVSVNRRLLQHLNMHLFRVKDEVRELKGGQKK